MNQRIDFEVPKGAQGTQCKSCKAPIVWITTGQHPDGRPKRMPLDLSSATKDLEGRSRALSHFAVCPDASRHRRGRSTSKPWTV